MSRDDHAIDLGVFGIGFLLFLVCVPEMGRWIWTASLPSDSPSAHITYVQVIQYEDSEAYYAYHDVAGVEYQCMGSTEADMGDVVLYDPSTPSRCRRPEMLWTLSGFERMILLIWMLGLGGMVYAVISFFFLSAPMSTRKARIGDTPRPPRKRGRRHRH